MENFELKERYIALAGDYVNRMSDMLFSGQPVIHYWIGGDYDGVLEIGDYFINYETVRTVVDYNVSFDTFDEWYTYTVDIIGSILEDKIKAPTLKEWIDGYKRLSDEEIEKLRKLYDDVFKAKERLEEEINKAISGKLF